VAINRGYLALVDIHCFLSDSNETVSAMSEPGLRSATHRDGRPELPVPETRLQQLLDLFRRREEPLVQFGHRATFTLPPHTQTRSRSGLFGQQQRLGFSLAQVVRTAHLQQ